MKKRFAAIALCACIVLEQFMPFFSQYASAAIDHSVYYTDFDKALSDRCIEFQESLQETGTKQYGLLYSLRVLCGYQLYVEFMGQYRLSNRDREGLGISSRQVSIYEQDLHSRLTSFNEKFGEDGKGYEKLSLTNHFTGVTVGAVDPETKMDLGSHKQCRADVRDNLIEKVPKYLSSLLSSVQSKVAEAKGSKEKEDAIKAENTTLLTNIYQVYLACINAEDDLNAYTPFNKNEEQVAFALGDGKGEKKMRDVLKKALDPYDDLINVAKDALSEETMEEITVDLTASYVDNLSNAQTNTQGVEIPEDARLDPLYYAIMSASSVYVPFQSYAGSTEFQAALKSLTNDDQVQLDMIEFYSATKDLRKPLYKREFDDNGYPSGTAKLMTLDDFFEDIKNGRSGSLCTVMGEFKYDGLSGAWIYEQGNDRNTVELDYTDTEDNADSELDESGSGGSADEDSPADDAQTEPEDNTSDDTASTGMSGFSKVFGLAGVTAVASAKEFSAGRFLKQKKVYYDSDKKRVIDADSGKKVSKDEFDDDQIKAIKDAGAVSADTAIDSDTLESDSDDDDDAESTESTDSNSDSSTEGSSESSESSSGSSNEDDDIGQVVDENGSDDSSSTDDSFLEDQAVFAYEEITDDTKLTEPLVMYGTDYSRAIDNTTSMILLNALKSSSNLNYVSDKTTRYVYINPYGDIVTDDNLVLLPGVANPLLYNAESEYNPYTAAFMNCYPKPFKKDSHFKLTSKQDIGKYIIVRQTSNKSKDVKTFAVLTDAIDSIKVTSPLSMVNMTTNFTVNKGDTTQPLMYQRLLFTDSNGKDGSDTSKEYQYTPLCESKSIQANGNNVFPYVVLEDLKYDVASVITGNVYSYLINENSSDDESRSVKAKFNENYILHNFLISGLNGTNNPKGYTSSTLNQYNRFVNGSGERFLTKLKSLSSTILNTTSDVRGVIGLRECMQNPVLGRILMLCRTNVPFFILVVVLVLLFSFSKMKLDLFQAAVKLLLSIVIAYLGITVIPTYLPMLFNVVINNVSETMSYKILATKTENESIGNVDSTRLKEDGTSDLTNGSITLYRSGVLNYQQFVNSVNVDEDEIIGGNIEIINQEAGLFVEGDSIKVSTSTLFDTLKIVDTPEDVDGTTLHYLKAYKTVNNNVDYYTPYYQIIDSFLEKLNTLERVSEVPRGMITYSNGVTKDNFLVYSYVNSKPFLTPGNYSIDVPDTLEDEDSVITLLQEEASQYEKDLLEAFGDKNTATDFLGIASWLYSPSDAMRQTLWYQTMQDQGYYDSDGEVNNKKMDDLITYVNYHTKRFIYKMDGQIGKLSDETMTKIICMRALTAFTVRVSQYGDWLYPFSLNYGEITLGDVLRSVFISDYAQYTNNDMDVVEYVGNNKGWLHLIVFDFLIVVLFVVVHVVQMLVYLMYVLLMVTVIIKVITQGNSLIPVKGFLKCTGLVMGGYTAMAIALSIVNEANANTICIYSMLIVIGIVTYVITLVVSSLLGDLANVGDSTVSVKVASGVGSGLRQAFNNVNVSNLFSQRNHEGHERGFGERNDFDYYSNYDAYDFDSDIDDVYYGPTYNSGLNSQVSNSSVGNTTVSKDDGIDYESTYDDLTELHDGSDAIGDFMDDLTSYSTEEEGVQDDLTD